jgi:tetratricopeptide (TPR) repeat protein
LRWLLPQSNWLKISFLLWSTATVALAVRAHDQSRHWQTTEHLFRHAINCDPDNVLVLNLLGHLLNDEGRISEATRIWHRAALLSPNQTDIELAQFERALKREPDKPEFMNNVAWYLATHPDDAKRDGNRALKLSQRSNELTNFSDPNALDTLAAAHAELGNFDEAIKFIERAKQAAAATGQQALIPSLDERLRLYQSRQPMRLPTFQ